MSPALIRATTRRRAFTLIEALVAVAAVSVITVAIAGVFSSVGKTVTQGRSVSRFTTYASRLERQLRDDISNMTRDGFLVIRNELVGDDDLDFTVADRNDEKKGVALSPDDPRPRPRRADELLFFRKGAFTSQRQPVVPGLTVSADAARVYYGHGIRFPEGLLDNKNKDATAQPQAGHIGFYADNSSAVLGQLRLGGSIQAAPTERDGPNAYASDWTLLRQVTPLAQPGSVNSAQQQAGELAVKAGLMTKKFGVYDSKKPEDFWFGDREYQLSGLLAAADVFGSLTQLAWYADPTSPYTLDPRYQLRDAVYSDNAAYPRGGAKINGVVQAEPFYASGVVDLATTDLEQIRSLVLRATLSPVDILKKLGTYAPTTVYNDVPSGGILAASITPGNPAAALMQSWMRDAFPTNQLYAMRDGAKAGFDVVPKEEFRTRVRYENDAPGYFNVLNDGLGDPIDRVSLNPTNKAEILRSSFLADRQMLSASIFAPGVSEFIVEWSFGEVVDRSASVENAGEMVWYGLARQGDADFDGTVQSTEWVARDYPFDRLGNGGSQLYKPFPNGPGAAASHLLDPRTVHGRDGSGSSNKTNPRYTDAYDMSVVLYSYFGYIDPRYAATDPPTVPWAWPKLIRVTMTLSDPADPLVQETFQYVFRVPEQ